jgi:serine/threonine protein kinase
MLSGKKVAIKKLPLSGDTLKLLVTEIQIMRTSDHPNIVEYFGSYVVDDELWVAMEFMGGGILTEIVEKHQIEMNEAQIAYCTREVSWVY